VAAICTQSVLRSAPCASTNDHEQTESGRLPDGTSTIELGDVAGWLDSPRVAPEAATASSMTTLVRSVTAGVDAELDTP
jgi:hypothetical protein